MGWRVLCNLPEAAPQAGSGDSLGAGYVLANRRPTLGSVSRGTGKTGKEDLW